LDTDMIHKLPPETVWNIDMTHKLPPEAVWTQT
jgi:hypothetical protein